ncbi:carbon-nitrogen hydrolase family protein [Bifidobacterium sp. CP2]|uniref:nitrilase-related carbon-nitrogen hydrolase n=1 Tax=Bifidobacterium sp. CP2 TaxID=2809025 RepID=UPI001BDBCBB3|nr:nitrilase-related carbon-nitrogen hydrolase [Bifidobacterium sp. CP2]MBT1182087.1 carbon-nitrogen hydrolase family protein [Bifidobacterium sp. CP2]
MTDGTHRTDETLKVAIAQFAVTREPDANLAVIDGYARRASDEGARLLLLPEGLIARDDDPTFTARMAQPSDGPFVAGLRRIGERYGITLMGTVHMPSPEPETSSEPASSVTGRVANVLVVIRGGDVIAAYRKLHLYDAFSERESDTVAPGDELPPVVDVDGWRIGVMTCYDVRFPETARSLAVRGADVIAVSAAWVRGARKERHWELLTAARALENTCYVLACSETGARTIGLSRVIDPLGEVVAGAGSHPGLITAELRRDALRDARESLPVLANRRFADPTLA